MEPGLDGRTVVVTGGTGVLGRAVVERLLQEGAAPVVTFRAGGESPDASFAGRVKTHAVDLTEEASVTQLFADVGPVWASVHLAGAFAMAPIDRTTAADFRRMFDANAMTCFLCCREAIRAMRRTSGGGRIVNVAARPAVIPTGGMVAYATSKAAVASITQSLAEEVKAEGILLNAVLPSTMDTPANRAAMPNADFTKWPKVEQVAEAIAFLTRPANALTSGALVPVYGRA